MGAERIRTILFGGRARIESLEIVRVKKSHQNGFFYSKKAYLNLCGYNLEPFGNFVITNSPT